jgi:NADH:ubiquinone oxidoreductase subunit 6 (subunit J)
MTGNIFLRTSVVFLCIGITLGMYMGGTHDFTQMPTHAHLNLVGGVWLFLAGLFYNGHPQFSRRAILIHYVIAVIGLLIFIPGIWGAQIRAPWAEPVVGIGSVLTAIQIVFFTVMVFIGTGRKSVLTGS